MRYASHVAALIGLLALGLALGDFASDPGLAGGVLILVLLAVLVVALGHLYKPGGVASRNPAPPPPRREPEPVEPAPVEIRASRRGRPRRDAPRGTGVWSAGWDASEADEARERRRQERLKRRDRG